MFCSIQAATARPPAVNQCNYNLRIQPVQYNLLATVLEHKWYQLPRLCGFGGHIRPQSEMTFAEVWMNTVGSPITTILIFTALPHGL